MLLFFILFWGLAKAGVTGISLEYNGLSPSLYPIKTFGASSQVEIFSGSSAKFKLTGSWIDIRSSIKLVVLDGQAITNVSVSKTGNSLPGISPAVLEFVINKTLTGRYRVEMTLNGGHDNITVKLNGIAYNWEDPNITVLIDPSSGVLTGPGVNNEVTEFDNSATFNQ